MLIAMKKLFLLFLFASLMLSLPAIAKRFTYGFRVAKMRIDYPFEPRWEVAPNPDMNQILKQRFHFIGKGAQCYVFESADGAYVIKLFRYDQPNCEEKVVQLFNACKIAYDLLREETGLIYIHLNPTPMNLPTLYCKDAVGRKYKFSLDQTRFAIQKKATDFRLCLESAKVDPDLMKKRIDQLLFLLQARASKNVRNADPSLSRNFGFLDDRAIEFDFGNYQLCEQLNQKTEIQRYTSKLHAWLDENAPEWSAYLDEKVKAL